VRGVDEEGTRRGSTSQITLLFGSALSLRHQGPVRGAHQQEPSFRTTTSSSGRSPTSSSLRLKARSRNDAPGIAGPPGTGSGSGVLSPGRAGAVGLVHFWDRGSASCPRSISPRPPLPAGAAGPSAPSGQWLSVSSWSNI